MRRAQLSVTVTTAPARAKARFSIRVSSVPPASKYGLPAHRSRISATSGTAPPSTAASAANSADGGGHVAHTTSDALARSRAGPQGVPSATTARSAGTPRAGFRAGGRPGAQPCRRRS